MGMWVPACCPEGMMKRYVAVNPGENPPSWTCCSDPTVTQTESMPSGSTTWTLPETVSVRLETTVVSSIVKDTCGGPGLSR